MFTLHCGSVRTLRMPQSKTWIGSDSSKLLNRLLGARSTTVRRHVTKSSANGITTESGLQ